MKKYNYTPMKMMSIYMKYVDYILYIASYKYDCKSLAVFINSRRGYCYHLANMKAWEDEKRKPTTI